MRRLALLLPLVLLFGLTQTAFAYEDQQPDMIMEKMVFKLTRGVTNMATCFLELPKQTDLTVREHGGVGLVIGSLKGIGMTAYRGFIGAVETAFFLVPQPGYYDPMIDPEFVWQEWDEPPKERYRLKPVEQGQPAAEQRGE